MKTLLFKFHLFTALFCGISLNAQTSFDLHTDNSKKRDTIDEILSGLTVREKIAQLFIVSFSSDPANKSTIEAEELIRKEGVGGLIIMNSGLTSGARMINHLQKISRIPLLVTIDGEWGVSMRFDSVAQFPRQMQLGALPDESLVYKMGVAIGQQSKRLGIYVNYAPTIDVNNNPRNPVINTRSFGEIPETVARYGKAYMLGMKDAGVAGSAKHFPGHGDTEDDSHNTLPLLNFSKSRIDSLELYPFRALIEAGVDMVMVGHLQIPSLDSTGRPSSISKPIVTDLLRGELEFNGIIVSDALNMKGISEFLSPEFIPLEAYKAGCDLILMPERVEEAITVMERAVQRGEISMHSLNMRVRKMLSLKMSAGLLHGKTIIPLSNLYEDLNESEFLSLISSISDNSVTIIRNRDSIIPLKNIINENIGLLSLGGDRNGKEFAELMQLYTHIDTVVLRGDFKNSDVKHALNKLEKNSLIVIAMHNTDARPQMDFGLDKDQIRLLTDFAKDRKVILSYFGNPLAIPQIENLERFSSVIIGYSNTISNNKSVAGIIFGSIAAKGKLPVTAGLYPAGYSLSSPGNLRLSYGMAEDFGIDGKIAGKAIDSIINNDISAEKYTGAQLIVMKDNRVIINKSYGSISATDVMPLFRNSGMISQLPVIIHLNQQRRLSLEDFAGKYLKRDRDSEFKNVMISDILMHRSNISDSASYKVSYSESNNQALKRIIEYITISQFENVCKEFIHLPIGMDKTSFRGETVFSNANDIAKFISLLNLKGEYGGVKIFNEQSIQLIMSMMHYYSESPNGNMIWCDSESNLAVIFLNNMEEINNQELKSDSGENIRRTVIDLLSGK